MPTTESTLPSKPLFQHSDGPFYHGGALIYAVAAYVLGFAGLFSESWLATICSVVLLGHGMTIAAYLIHECGHNTVFRDNTHNARLGTFFTWLCGAAYGTYEDIRYKHFRHHVDNDDVVWFDYETWFQSHPLIYRAARFLETFYIPAHDLIMHAIMVFSSFIIPQRRDQRVRNVTVILIRGCIFLALCWFHPKVAILYAIAYILMMNVLRFMDSLQHDYPYTTNLFEGPVSENKGDLDWEQEHTFSNPISLRFPILNWLVLNFGYHNAHHARPTTPWYRLPALHKELFGEDPSRVIALWPQLQIFKRYRAYRILHDAPGLEDVEGEDFLRAAQQARVTGGNAASFLTAF